MANKITWSGSPANATSVLTGNSLGTLGNAAFGIGTTAYDNTSNLDQYASVTLSLGSITPTGAAYVSLYLIQSNDGSTYEDAPATTNPAFHQQVATCSVQTTANTHVISTPWFRIPPNKFKFALYNATGVSFTGGNSSNTATLYTSDDQVN